MERPSVFLVTILMDVYPSMSETRVNLVKNLLADPEGDRLTKLTFLVLLHAFCDWDETYASREDFDYDVKHIYEGLIPDTPEWEEIHPKIASFDASIDWDWIQNAVNAFIKTHTKTSSREWCNMEEWFQFIKA